MIDFKTIIGQHRLYNFHSHTQFCDGKSEMENFVIEAIAENFSDYGFSPHSPIPIDSSCNMNTDDVETYFSEVNRLKAKYGDKINLYASMEIDYLNNDWGPSNSYFDTLDLEYRIGSVHFIPDDNGKFIDIDGRYVNFKQKMDTYFHNDIRSVVEKFFSHSMAMVEAEGFEIMGHFDKIGHNASHFQEGIEDERWYNNLVRQLFDCIMDHNLIIEVNTKAWAEHNRFFPNQKYFDWLIKYNAPIMINSDAHYPELINAGRDAAMTFLDSLAK